MLWLYDVAFTVDFQFKAVDFKYLMNKNSVNFTSMVIINNYVES